MAKQEGFKPVYDIEGTEQVRLLHPIWARAELTFPMCPLSREYGHTSRQGVCVLDSGIGCQHGRGLDDDGEHFPVPEKCPLRKGGVYIGLVIE